MAPIHDGSRMRQNSRSSWSSFLHPAATKDATMQCSIWSNRENMAQLGEQVFSSTYVQTDRICYITPDISCKCSRHDHHLSYTSAFHKHRAPRILKAQLNKGHKHRTTQLLPKHLTPPNRILFSVSNAAHLKWSSLTFPTTIKNTHRQHKIQ